MSAYLDGVEDWLDDLRGMSVVHGEFVVVTADGAECAAHRGCARLLAQVRSSLGLDVVFVSQAVGGEPVARERFDFEARDDGAGDGDEAQHGHATLARLPSARPRAPSPAQLSMAVATESIHHGTVCCTGRQGTASAAEIAALRSVAQLLAAALTLH